MVYATRQSRHLVGAGRLRLRCSMASRIRHHQSGVKSRRRGSRIWMP